MSDKKFSKIALPNAQKIILSTMLLNEDRVVEMPYYTLYNMDSRPTNLSVNNILDLKEIFITQTREYFADLFKNKFYKFQN